jgi:hypothetical protein
LFIRCGPDPLGRIAEHVFGCFGFGAHRGRRQREDTDLSAARLGHSEPSEYVAACRQPGMLMKSLHEISAKLPFTLVIILDQAGGSNHPGRRYTEYRRQFFRFIREFSRINFHCCPGAAQDTPGASSSRPGRQLHRLSQGASADTSTAGAVDTPPALTNRVVKADVALPADHSAAK